MLSKILMLAVIALIGLLLYASTKPNEFAIQRQISVNAPAANVFAHINDFHQWVHWSPWEKKDSAMERQYSAIATGEGASYAWQGKKVGAGKMQIIQSQPNSKVVIQLDFVKPMQAHNTVEFVLQPSADGQQTTVIWKMYGPDPFMGKLFSTLVNRDKLIGRDFEAGLQALKTLVEKN